MHACAKLGGLEEAKNYIGKREAKNYIGKRRESFLFFSFSKPQKTGLLYLIFVVKETSVK